MASKPESVEDLFQQLYENVKHQASSCRKYAQQERDAIAQRREEGQRSLIRDEHASGAAFAYDLMAEHFEEDVANFKEFFCVGCDKFMHVWDGNNFSDKCYKSETVDGLCDDCADVAARDQDDNRRCDEARDAAMAGAA